MNEPRPSAAVLDWLCAHPTFNLSTWDNGSVSGYPIHDHYVETFWLPIIGPTAMFAARQLDTRLTRGHTRINLAEFGSGLGVSTGTGRHTAINRTIGRLVDFGKARISPDGERLELLTVWPALPPRSRRRLPPGLLDLLIAHEKADMLAAAS